MKNNKGVAEELADNQKEISIAEFFEQNKQMLGFGSKTRAIITAVKEGVDNSLDAAEEAEILPDIVVEIDKKEDFYTVTIEDNGPGIPRDSIPNVFGKLLYGSRFHRLMQRRGQQGIGISAAVLYSQLTTGNPARVLSKTEDSDEAHYVEIGIDTDTNEPIIHQDEMIEWSDKDHGIRIEMDMEGNMRARKRLQKYIELTAVVNPHSTVILKEPGGEVRYDERPVDKLPSPVEEIKPHPHGVELGTLMDMLEKTDCRQLRSFYKQEFTRVGDKTALEILDNFRDVHYGRSIGWDTQYVEKDEYIEAVKSSVRGKGAEATNVFAETLYERMDDSDYVSKEKLQNIITEVSEVAQEETGKQFATTVQENAVNAVWEVVEQNVRQSTVNRVQDVTIDRKADEFIELIGSNLADRFASHNNDNLIKKTKLTDYIEDSADEAIEEYDGSASFGDTALDKVFTEFWENSDTISKEVPKISDISGDRDVCDSLLTGMVEADAMAPPTKCLSPITSEHIETGLKSRYNADFYTSVTRDAEVARGQPFIVEAGIAYGGDIESDGQIQLSRFANRVPLVYQKGACAMTKQIKGIRWNNYYRASDAISQNSGSIPQGPMVLLVHVASTNVPFTSESKDAVSDVPEIEKEVERAVRDVARDLKDHLSKERSRRKRKEKRNVIGGLLSDMSDKLETMVDDEIDSKKESQARILNNVYVDVDGDVINITNFSGRKEDVSLEVTTENKTDTYDMSLTKGESGKIELDSEIESVEINSPVSPKVTKKA